jgi:hypothetical protein
MNALKLLTGDHRRHEVLLDQLKDSRKYSEFRDELIRHVNVEEEIFYPRLFEIDGLTPIVTVALEEHTICMQLLQELDDENLNEIVREAKLTVLREL